MPKKSVQKKKRPEKLKNRFLFLCSACSLVILFSLISFNLNSLFNSKKVLGTSTENANSDLKNQESFWQEFLKQNPNYLPGIVELAKIERKLGFAGYAEELLLKVKEINPNFPITP